MPGTGRNTRLYKLKPTDGPLNRDDVSTWIFTALSYARQNGWSQFLTGGDNPTWVPTDEDPNNGLTGATADETRKLRDSFKDFIAAIAANCPTGFTDTVIRESTSFKWIEEKINKTFNLTTKGESFLDGLNLTFKFDDSFTHSQAWMSIMDQYYSSLLPVGSKYMGKILQAKETISPLAMNFLVREWLLKIDPRLPEHVRTSRGHLFTTERPTLACNQQILCDQIEVMLQELDGKESPSSNNVSVSYIPSGRGRAGFSRGRPPRPNFSRSRGTPSNQRYPGPARRANQSCHLCLEARRYDSSITHSAPACPFPQLRRNNTRQLQSAPQFKVLLVPTSNPAQPNHPTYIDQHMENMTGAQKPPSTQQFPSNSDQPYQEFAHYNGQYDDQYVGDGQYQGYEDDYGQAFIEELPPL